MRRRGLTALSKHLQEQMEAHRRYLEKRGPLWVACLDEPCDMLWAARGNDQVALVSCLTLMHREWRFRDTEDASTVAVEVDALEHIVSPEPSMRAVMRCLRASGLHGFYYKPPEVEREHITGERTCERKEWRF